MVKCSKTATELANHSSNHLTGIFLETLPSGKQIPNDYVLQVQAITNSTTQGAFGVFFRNQSGNQQGTYSFLLDTTNNWRASSYDNDTGAASPLVELSTQGKVAGTMTIDIVVQGSTFTFYLNGIQQGDAISGTYTTGTLGLAVDVGADVSFRNLALYNLP